MLEEINISNLGVIEKATLSFSPGLNVITGETGAGKTMVLTALGLLLGKKSDPTIVRVGANNLSVEGCWNVKNVPQVEEILETGAVLEDDNSLYINRTVTREGKSRIVVGGKTTPSTVLSTFSESLVRIHGQSDQIRLRNTNAQREALDSYIGAKYDGLLEKYADQYATYRKLTAKLKEVRANQTSLTREYEFLKNVVEEYETVAPQPGEDEALKQEALTLSNVETLTTAVAEALNYMVDEDSGQFDVSSAVASAAKTLHNVTEYDPTLTPTVNDIETALDLLRESTSTLNSYLENADVDSLQRLEEINTRLMVLKTFIKKYGVTLEDVLVFCAESAERLKELDPSTNNVDVLEEQVNSSYQELKKLGGLITKLRTNNATVLSKAVNAELEDLAMGGTKLTVSVTPTENFTATGCDDVVFMISLPGSGLKPLNKSASGGELSRIMLALEIVIADPNSTSTFVYDEVDAGIGGGVAIKIGEKLAQLSSKAQVIVVSHLAQVAAFADNQLKVVKNVSGDSVVTSVVQLDYDERVEELARMLSGLDQSESGKAHALEMLDNAKKLKKTF